MKKLLILIAITVATIGTVTYADARPRHYNSPKKIITDLINTNVASTETLTLSAKRHHFGRRYVGRRCDGFNGCRCGVTQARAFGLPLNYNGFNLKLAKDWGRAFPATNAQPGAIVVQNRKGGGHVSRIVQLTSQCSAIVSDDKGQYNRDICSRGARYVMPGGGTGGFSTQYASQRQSRNMQFASLSPTYGYDPSAVR